MATSDASAVASTQATEVEPTPPLVAVVPHPAPEPLSLQRGNVIWAIAMGSTLAVVMLLLRFLPTVAWPLVLAAIGAYLLDPIVNWAAKRGISRDFASLVVVLLGCGVLVGVVVMLLPKLVVQIANIPAHFRAAIEILLGRLALLNNEAIPKNFEELLRLAQVHVPEILSRALPGASGVVGVLVGGSLSVLSLVLAALIVPVVGYYLLRAWPQVVRGAIDFVPPSLRPSFKERMREIDDVLHGFIRGQLTMAAVLSGLYASGLTAVGLKLAVVVGLTTGLGNLVPYVGTASGLTLAIASCLVDFGFDYHLMLVVGMFVSIMLTDSMFITPRIVGNRVGLSPAAVIVSVLALGSLFGFGGVLLAVPSVAILKVVVRVLAGAYRETRLYREG